MRDSDAALLCNSPETPSLPTASLQIKKKSACSNKFGQTDEGFGRRLAMQFPRNPKSADGILANKKEICLLK